MQQHYLRKDKIVKRSNINDTKDGKTPPVRASAATCPLFPYSFYYWKEWSKFDPGCSKRLKVSRSNEFLGDVELNQKTLFSSSMSKKATLKYFRNVQGCWVEIFREYKTNSKDSIWIQAVRRVYLHYLRNTWVTKYVKLKLSWHYRLNQDTFCVSTIFKRHIKDPC